MGFIIVEGEPGPPGRFTLNNYIPNTVVDPILVWWRLRGPVTVPRLPDTAEVVRHRVS